jgi:integrase
MDTSTSTVTTAVVGHGLLSDLYNMVNLWDTARPDAELVLKLNEICSAHKTAAAVELVPNKSRRLGRNRKMSRRCYQYGSREPSGKWWVVRFWEYIPNADKPIHRCEKICPIKGQGALNARQRQLRAQQIVDASGVNDEFLQSAKTNRFAAVTFREQAEKWMKEDAKRKRDPLASGTIEGRYYQLHKHIYPNLGDLPLSEVNNATVKPFVAKLVAANLKPATIKDIIGVVKLVVASIVDEEGEPIYPRHWSAKLMDIPRVITQDQNTPTFSEEIMSSLARWGSLMYRTLFILCAAAGLRIGEALGLEIGKHFTDDFSTLRIEQKARKSHIETRLKTPSSWREVDLDPRVAAILKEFAGGRTSGLLFCTRTGKPISQPHVLKFHLHRALKTLGYVNPKTGDHKAGTHAFRRFRETHLGKCEGLPRGLRIFWMGHGEKDMTDHYDKVKDDRAFRKAWAKRCGVGFVLPPIVHVVRSIEEESTDGKAA